MQRVIDSRRYLMRDKRPVAELRKLHKEYCHKYHSNISLHQWLVERGKVYEQIK